MDFGHVWTAMVTPFDARGNIDIGKTKQLIDYLLANGTDALVIAGTTGESPTLTEDEKLALFRLVVQHVNKRAPVIAGTGNNDTNASIQLTKKAADIGVDGIMLVAPYYNKPSQAGLYAHFKEIASATTLPVMLYNVPGRTAVNIAGETVIELSKITNIVAVKEASGDLEQMAAIIEATDDTFRVYTGDDSLMLPSLAIGSSGVVSVAAHVIGNEMQMMFEAFQSGNVKKAASLHRELLPIMKGMFYAPNPTCVKYALQLNGLDVGGVRLPLVSLTAEEQQHVYSLVKSK